MSALTNRREFLKILSGLSIAGFLPFSTYAQQNLPMRAIPGTNEQLPVIGLGSSKPVLQIPEYGTEPLSQVIKMLVDQGGSVIDTAPRTEAIDREFGKVLLDPRWKDSLFVSTKINSAGKQRGIEQMQQTQRLFGKRPIDLVQIESMVDIKTHWPGLKEWQDNGETRYIGVTVARTINHEQIESFMKNESPDFVQLNYSVAEPQAEQRLLPLAEEKGIAVLINRPFMNGNYFQKIRGHELPGWAAEFDCESWAQFSLKYILAHSAVTCVLTETTNPGHMQDNLQAAFGRLPDLATKARMRAMIENF